MNWKLVLGSCLAFLLQLALSQGARTLPKCGFVYDEGGLAIAGYVKDKFKTKAETEGPVCPDKCGKELLTEINTKCEAKFTAHCVETCEGIPLTDTDPIKNYNNCCTVQGINKDGDLNCYTFVDNDGIFLVNYGGNAFSVPS